MAELESALLARFVVPMPALLKRVLSIPLAIAVLIYEGLDRLLGPLVRPVAAYLAALAIVDRLGRAIAGLPRYWLLALLAIPFVIIEPLKALSLYWAAVGHPLGGGAALVLCHVLSILTSERVLHLGKAKLLTIGWFARLYFFVTRLRDQALTWLKRTAAWRGSVALVGRVRDGVRRALSRA